MSARRDERGTATRQRAGRRGADLRVEMTTRPGADPVPAKPCRELLRRAARQMGVMEGTVSVLLCRDAEMAGINRRTRGREGPTDVLSFPAGEGFSGEGPHLGDIVVSTDAAARRARAARRPLQAEVLTLLAHGLLHLLGYDHETDTGEMMRLQRDVCRRLIGRGPAGARGLGRTHAPRRKNQ